MLRRRWWAWIVMALALTGCAGGAKAPPSSAPTYAGGSGGSVAYAEKSTTASPSAAQPGGGYDYRSEQAPAPSTNGGMAPVQPSSPDGPPPPPTERPGLATQWGETRYSHVHDVEFVRADADRPFALTSIYYNDRDGVDALARYHGGSPRFFEVPTRGNVVTISMHDGNGNPLEALRAGDRTYVVGEAGQRYSIVFSNHTGHRFEIVATVDGLDVINGRPGDLSNRGYVLLPHATLEIDGFRQSEDTVAAFRFGSVGESYAAQTGNARNVGVIGVAFFAERGDVYTDEELETRDTANPFPNADPRFARPPR